MCSRRLTLQSEAEKRNGEKRRRKREDMPSSGFFLMANSRKLRALYILTGQIYESTFQPPMISIIFFLRLPPLGFSFTPTRSSSSVSRYFFSILSIFPQLFSYPWRYISILSLTFYIYLYTYSYNK